MSEKRFQKTRIVDKWGGIYDSKTDEILKINDITNKLNELAEENEQLKKENGKLQREVHMRKMSATIDMMARR